MKRQFTNAAFTIADEQRLTLGCRFSEMGEQ